MQTCLNLHSCVYFFTQSSFLKVKKGTSLVVQWLRSCTFTSGGMGLISGLGTKVPHATQKNRKKKKVKKNLHGAHLSLMCNNHNFYVSACHLWVATCILTLIIL